MERPEISFFAPSRLAEAEQECHITFQYFSARS
jgi:hypothetical protein